MGQISTKFRNGHGRLFHWCEPCGELHPLPIDAGWTFNGDYERPTMTPSFLQHGADPGQRCHYILTAGVLNYRADCSHALAGQSVPLFDLPADYCDFCDPVEIRP